MTKQDFELIAERIYTWPANADDPSADMLRRQLAEHFAESLKATNRAFQTEKFIRAATTGEHIRRSILPRA